MPNYNKGPNHNRWKGGRRKHSNGYMTIKVEPGHHLDIGNGYAYEHRYVAEQKMGRRLLPNEVVHHINHDKQDNRPGNLEILTRAAHRFEHRSVVSNKKHPEEPNYIVECACGCKTEFNKYDSTNRPRKFVSGHNLNKRVSKNEQD
jgi:hypothetical protein